jgi:TPR repeat protein
VPCSVSEQAVDGAYSVMVLIAEENKAQGASLAGTGRVEMKQFRKAQLVLAGIVALMTLLVYLPALRNGFVGVWDDNTYIVENPHIRSLDAVFFRWAFLDFHASNWHPLTWISHAVDYMLWGLNPLGHHLTNIVLHAVNTLVVALLIIRLLEAAKEYDSEAGLPSVLNERMIMIAAGVTGILFGIHPVHVESVAWVAERKDLLCALFFLVSIMAYTSYLSYKTYKTYMLTLVFFILALMSKPMAVTLPVVLLILDWFPFGRIRSFKTLWAASIEKLPFIVLSLVSSFITIFAQRSGESIISLEFAPLSSRLLVAVQSLLAYLGKMLLPLNLVPFYPYPKSISVFSLEYLPAIGLAIGITAACAVLVKKHKFWLSAWGYYVVTLIPVLGIVQVGNQSMADRYSYLPSLGPFLIAGLCVSGIAEKAGAFPRRRIFVTFAGAAGVIVAFFTLSYGTVRQIDIWENGFTLWDHTIAKGFESAAAYNNRGLSLDERGLRENARVDFEKAIALDPRNYFAYNNLGVLYGKEGSYQTSIEYFLKAIAINPRHADSYCNLGLSYFNLNQYDNALEHYNKAIDLKPDFDMAYLDRGILLFTIGEKERALADYRKACDLGNGKACEAFHLATDGLLSR